MSDSTETSRKSRARSHPLAVFAFKTIVVTIAVTFGLLLVVDQLVSDLNDLVSRQVTNVRFVLKDQMGEPGAPGTLTRLQALLDRAVALSNQVPPERQQKLLDDIRILAGRARPFVLAVESAFVEPSEAAPQAAPQKDK